MTHPATRDLLQSAARPAEFQSLLQKLIRSERGPFSLSGLVNTAKALYLVLLYQATEKPLFVVVDGNKQAETLMESIEVFFDLLFEDRDLPAPQLIPALDVLPQQRLSPHNEIAEKRAVGLWRLSAQKVPITVVPAAAALLRTESAEFYRQLALTLRVGEELALEDLVQHMESVGYERREPVEMVGEYSVRGGIFDVFPAEASRPVRVEFFGDEIESIRQFDVESQRSVLKVNSAMLLPLAEYPRSRPLLRQLAEAAEQADLELSNPGEVFPGWEFLVPMVRPRTQNLFALNREAYVILDEPGAIESAVDRLWQRLDHPDRPAPIEPDKNFLRWDELGEVLADRTQIRLQELELVAGPPEEDGRRFHISTRPSLAFQGNMPVAVAEARNLVEQGYRVAFFAASVGELERLADILQEYSVPFQLGLESTAGARPYLAERAYYAGAVSSTYLIKGRVRRGAVLPDSQLAILGSEDLFDSSDLIARPGPTKSQLAAFAADIADLKPGDYVVHTTHGVGQFLGIREIVQGDKRATSCCSNTPAKPSSTCRSRAWIWSRNIAARAKAQPPLDRLGGVDLGAHQVARQGQNARHGGRAVEALRAAPHGRGLRLFARQQLAARVRRRFRIHRDQRPARRHQADQARHGERRIPWTGCCAATSATARPKWPCARRSRRWATASRWRCWRPPRCSRSSTSKRSSGASRLPGAHRNVQPLSHAEGNKAGAGAIGRRQGGYRHRNAPPAFEGRRVSTISACWWWTKSSASACGTRSG